MQYADLALKFVRYAGLDLVRCVGLGVRLSERSKRKVKARL